MNDDLAGRIISGRVQVKPNVKEFLGTSVVFADGSIINEVSVWKIKKHKDISFKTLSLSRFLCRNCKSVTGGHRDIRHWLQLQFPFPASQN